MQAARAAAVRGALVALTVGCLAIGALADARVDRAQPAPTPAAISASAPAGYDTSAEQAFISRINGLRSSKGLSILVVDGQLTGVARGWTDKMVSNGKISHNPNLAAQMGSRPWRKLGENVGVGYDVEGLWQAFLNSPGHYNNLVDPEWTHLGVGAARSSDGRLYTTHNFMRLEGATPPPTSPPPTSPPATSPPATGTPQPTTPTTAATPPPPKPKPPAKPPADPERVAAVLVALRPLST